MKRADLIVSVSRREAASIFVRLGQKAKRWAGSWAETWGSAQERQ